MASKNSSADGSGKSPGSRGWKCEDFLEDPEDFSSGSEQEATDHDHEGSSEGKSEYSHCRSANFSSCRSWYHSPESDLMFGGADLSGYFHDGGGSGDAFVDALDEYFDSERDRDFFQHGGSGIVRGTGLYDDADTVALPSEVLYEELNYAAVEDTISREVELRAVGIDEIKDNKTRPSRESESSEIDVDGTKTNTSETVASLLPCCHEEPDVVKEISTQSCVAEKENDPTKPEGLKTISTQNYVPEKENVSKKPELVKETTLQTCVPDEGNVPKKPEPSVVEKRKCVMRLGSKEAEDLLRLDMEEIIRPLRLSSIEKCTDWSGEQLGPDELSRYVERLEVRETYMDTLWDMEEILLDTGESSGNPSFWSGKSASNSPVKSAWTSGATSVYDGLWKVDSVEVTGARQRRGGTSLGDRVMGVREHTIYRIRVRSGENEWEIERRYREFVDLFQQLKRMFTVQSRVQLPSPWQKVTLESRKVFGNTSPDVVEFRSALLQVCLQSSLQAGVPISTAAPLLRFLFPSPGESRLPMLTDSSRFSPELAAQDLSFSMQLKELGSPKSHDAVKSPERQDSLISFGRTIRLILQIQTRKPLNQELLNQRNLCAGCYEQLNSIKGVASALVKSFGWGKPRFCEYTGQLYCVGCHHNETAILPARVLQSWDFSRRVVSQLAKAYLDSIYDQPMLCVSAVNPFLYSKVPILSHVSEMRRRLSRVVNCIRCPSRSRIPQLLGSRRYLLEQNDFYALSDLADLSKGAFAVLPGLLQATLEKLTIHVTRKCSVCLELGEPCGAKRVCDSPQNLIYPYEEENVHRCQLCTTAYHQSCFKAIETCRVCTRESPISDEQHSSASSSYNNTFSTTLEEQEEDREEQQGQEEDDNSIDLSYRHGSVPWKPKRKLFSGLFGTAPSTEKTQQQNERLQRRRNSAFVNMSAVLGGPLEL